MLSWRQRVNNVVYHLDYILSKVIKPLVGYLAFLSLVFAGIAFYMPAPMVILPISMLMLFFFPFVVAFCIERLIDEITSGRMALYLVAGLTRIQYVVAWIIATMVFPITGFLLGLLIPITIISPDMVSTQISIPPNNTLEMNVLLEAIIIQIYNNVSIMVFIGLATRRKGMVFLAAVLITIVLPIIIAMVSSINNFVLHALLFIAPVYYIALPLEFKAPYWLANLFALIIAIIFTIQSIMLAKKVLEV